MFSGIDIESKGTKKLDGGETLKVAGVVFAVILILLVACQGPVLAKSTLFDIGREFLPLLEYGDMSDLTYQDGIYSCTSMGKMATLSDDGAWLKHDNYANLPIWTSLGSAYYVMGDAHWNIGLNGKETTCSWDTNYTDRFFRPSFDGSDRVAFGNRDGLLVANSDGTSEQFDPFAFTNDSNWDLRAVQLLGGNTYALGWSPQSWGNLSAIAVHRDGEAPSLLQMSGWYDDICFGGGYLWVTNVMDGKLFAYEIMTDMTIGPEIEVLSGKAYRLIGGDADGVVFMDTASDSLYRANNFAGVPEPSSLAALLAGLVMVTRTFRRRRSS